MTRNRPAERLPTPAAAEPHLVQALSDAVRGSRTARVPWPVLQAAAVDRDASVATEAGGRQRLGAALAALAGRGDVLLPAAASGWDRDPGLPLPQWVRRPPTPAAPRDRVEISPDLLTALPSQSRAALQGLRLNSRQVATLTAVCRWLADGGTSEPVVPMRERALGVLGHEKAFDALAGSTLFTRGVLSWELLRCLPVPPPWPVIWVPGQHPTRSVACFTTENASTWWSLRATAAACPDRHAGVHVGYGSGQQFAAGATQIGLLSPPVARVSYFGDIDERGLTIPAQAATAAAAAGVAPVVPALGLYRRLLERGIREPGQPRLDPDRAAQVAAWVGPLAAAVTTLLTAGVRLAQEAIGMAELAGTAPADWA